LRDVRQLAIPRKAISRQADVGAKARRV